MSPAAGASLGCARSFLLVLGFHLACFCSAPPARSQCPPTGYEYPRGRSVAFFKPDFPIRAKDFALVKKDGLYHVFYLRVDRSNPGGAGTEIDFGHIYSSDLRTWYELPPVNPGGGYAHVWAPTIVEKAGTYYMFFTAVDASSNQRIALSTSTDLTTWTHVGIVFSCSNVPWASCPSTNQQFRDPFVMRDIQSRDGTGVYGWLMYYTASTGLTCSDGNGNPVANNIIGMAWAPYNNLASWQNLALGGSHDGRILITQSCHEESPHFFNHGGTWYLFDSGPNGIQYYTGYDPTANYAWNSPVPITSILGTTEAAGFPQNWFASEGLSDNAIDYLLFIHDYDPPPCDPICDVHNTPSTIEIKQITWSNSNQTFSLSDLPPFTTDNTAWVQQCGPATPAPRWGASLVNDTANNRMILFGGTSAATDGSNPVTYGDVWSYSLVTRQWTQLFPAGSSPPRSFHAAMYDPIRQRMLVVGGNVSGVDNRILYALSLSGTPTWSTPVVNGIPSPGMYDVTGAYDSGRDQFVTVDIFNGAWKLTLSTATPTWSAIRNSAPSFPHEGTAVYDAGHQRLLFIGGWDVATPTGCPAPLSPTNQIRSLDLTVANPVWTTLSTAPWQPRYRVAAAYDAAHDALMVFGGVGYSQYCTCGTFCTAVVKTDIPYNDVWKMNLGNLAWTQDQPAGDPPKGRGRVAAAFDPVRAELTAFGGGDFHDDPSNINCYTNCNPIHIYNYRNDTWTFRTDAVAPAAFYLSGSGGCYDHIWLQWYPPGDDGLTGQAAAYDLRWSTSQITEANFLNGTPLSVGSPLPPGSEEIYQIDVPRCSTPRYYAIRARDEAQNWSPVSNSLRAGPACPRPPIQCFDAGQRPVAQEDIDVPKVLGLSASQPDPAGSEFLLQMDVPRNCAGENYRLCVFDLLGRQVTTIGSGKASPGSHSLRWNLADVAGDRVGRGIYFLRLRIGSAALTRRLIVLK